MTDTTQTEQRSGERSAREKLEFLLDRQIEYPCEVPFDKEYCESLRGQLWQDIESNNSIAALLPPYLQSVAFGIPRKGTERERESELAILKQKILPIDKCQRYLKNVKSLAECLNGYYSSEIPEWQFPHLLAGDLGNFVTNRMLGRFSLARLGLVPEFNEMEFEDAYSTTLEFFKKCISRSASYDLGEYAKFGKEGTSTVLGAMGLNRALETVRSLGIDVNEIDIDRQAVRKYIVDAYFNNPSEQWKPSKPQDISKAIRELDAYLGTGEAK